MIDIDLGWMKLHVGEQGCFMLAVIVIIVGSLILAAIVGKQ